MAGVPPCATAPDPPACRSRRLLLRWAAVAVCTLVLSGCGGSGHSPPQSGHLGSGRGAPSLAEVAALLGRHGQAVLTRSTAAFLFDVDPAPPSADFRSRQAEQAAALSVVPLQSWAYAVNAPVTDPSATAAAARRLGAPASIVHVTLTYALQRVDPVPASHDLWWTFVSRRGHVYLAGDTDMANVGGASWRGPWDFGPLVVEHGVASLVLGHPQDAASLSAVAAAVDAAVPVVSRIWGAGWAQRVAAVVPASEAEFAALAGPAGAFADVSAEAVFEAPNVATGAGAAARVLIDPTALDRLSAVGRRIVVQHELTHIAAATATGPASPRWLVEGFAEYVGNLGSGQPVPVAAAELRRDLAHGRPPAALPGDAAFAPGSAGLPQAYQQSWLACRLIAARVGEAGLVRLYRLVGGSEDSEQHAVTAAVQSVLHEPVSGFVAQWRDYLTAQLR